MSFLSKSFKLLTVLEKTKTPMSQPSRADLGMILITFIWGFHYIVLKDGISNLDPLVFNALRFTIALPILILFALRRLSAMKISRHDMLHLLIVSLLGPAGFQVLYIFALERTPATNSALLLATTPTWVAIISLMLGAISWRWLLALGIMFTLGGVSLVIVGQGGTKLSFAGDAMTGSLMTLGAAGMFAFATIMTKPLVDRYGGIPIAIWSHWISWVALVALATPALSHLHTYDIPLDTVPHLLYSGLAANAGGFLVYNYAIQELGPTRTSMYNNFTPLITAAAGILLLGEKLSPLLLVGGLLTFVGVTVVRKNTKAPLMEAVDIPRPVSRSTRAITLDE